MALNDPGGPGRSTALTWPRATKAGDSTAIVPARLALWSHSGARSVHFLWDSPYRICCATPAWLRRPRPGAPQRPRRERGDVLGDERDVDAADARLKDHHRRVDGAARPGAQAALHGLAQVQPRRPARRRARLG